jgi:hypothetical protein
MLIAEVVCGVKKILKARSGCPRWNSRGTAANRPKQNEATSAKRAKGSNSLTLKTWYSALTTKAPATRPVM